MNAIVNALARAFVSLLHPKMLWLMVWPVIVALVIWVTLAMLYWGEAAQWVAAQLHQWPPYEWAVSVWPLRLIAAWFGWILLLLLFVPVVLFGYFNQRVFRYDALAEYGTAAEIAEIVRRHRGGLFLLGVALALVGHVPVLGLFMPVYGGLAFIHYGLGRLGELRGEPIEGAAARV